MKDYRDKEIAVGDIVTYAWRRGSDMGLKTLKVCAVADDHIVGLEDKLIKPRKIHLKTGRLIAVLEPADALQPNLS